MDLNEARSRLERMIAWDTDPKLETGTVNDLLRRFRAVDQHGHEGYEPWLASTLRVVGDEVVPFAVPNGHYYVVESVTATGRTGFGEADFVWPIDGTSVTEGEVTWRDAGADPWVPNWRFNAAAAEGWRLKAAACAHYVFFQMDGGTVNKNMVHDHCVSMADMYAKRARGRGRSLRVGTPGSAGRDSVPLLGNSNVP